MSRSAFVFFSVAIFSTLIFGSCHHEVKKTCSFTSDDEQLEIYNTLLSELVENRMYLFYLGGKEEELRKKYLTDDDNLDTVEFDREVIKAHNFIFDNPASWGTLYLDTTTRGHFNCDSIHFFDFRERQMIASYAADT